MRGRKKKGNFTLHAIYRTVATSVFLVKPFPGGRNVLNKKRAPNKIPYKEKSGL